MASWNPASWAEAVLRHLGAPITQNNIDNIDRWIRAEKGDDWCNRNNPLNSSVGTTSTDGLGTYPNLGVAAQNVAGMINQSNMSGIKQALMSNASLPSFSAAVVASPWASSHYGGNPQYFVDVPPLLGPPAPPSAGVADQTSPGTGSTPPTTSTTTDTGASSGGKPRGQYTVKAGDTLWAIAKSYGVSLAALEAANPQIANPHWIFPGNVVNIPGQPPPSNPSPGHGSPGVPNPIRHRPSPGWPGWLFRIDVAANLAMGYQMEALASQLGDARLRVLSAASHVSPPPAQVTGLLGSLHAALADLARTTEDIALEARSVVDNARRIAAQDQQGAPTRSGLGPLAAWPEFLWGLPFTGAVPSSLAPIAILAIGAIAQLASLPKPSLGTVKHVSDTPVSVPPPPTRVAPRPPISPISPGIATTGPPAALTAAQEAQRFAGLQIYWNGPTGRVLLSPSSWLGGHGVNVYSDYGTDYGGQWQCVNLVNRLYRERGWISGEWYGNGNSMLNNLPPGVTDQLNGHITRLVPGDAVSMQVLPPGEGPDAYGHVVIVNKIIKCSDGYMVQFVNQNCPTVYTYGRLSPSGVLTMNPSGDWRYDIIGVAHATANTG